MRSVLRLLLGFLLLSFVAGSSSAALACVAMPVTSASTSMPADCPDQPVKMSKHGTTSACVQMCAAIAPDIAPVTAAAPPASREFVQASRAILAWDAGLEPPPPRTAS